MAGTPDLYKLQATGAADPAWVGRKTQRASLSAGGGASAGFAGRAVQTGTLTAAGGGSASFAGRKAQSGWLSAGGTAAGLWAGAARFVAALAGAGGATVAAVGRKAQRGTLAAGGGASAAFTAVGGQTGTLAAGGAGVAAFAGGKRQTGTVGAGGSAAGAFAGGRTQAGTFALGGGGAGAFAGDTVQTGTWAATGAAAGAFAGYGTTAGVGRLAATGGAAPAIVGRSTQRGTLAALAAAGGGFVGRAGGTGPITIFVPYSDIPCAACCLTPDVLCFRVVGCDGAVSTGRLRRIPPTSNTDFRWDTCTAGSVRVTLQCDFTTGVTQAIVSDGRGGGGPLAGKVPDKFCGGYHIAWTHPTDSMPVFRCGPGNNQTVSLVEITDVFAASCAACLDGGGGVEAKTITAETGRPCPTVCDCCGLVPCRQCLVLAIDAFGCDFSGMSVVLESPDGGCTWEGTLQPDTHLPSPELNCPGTVAASATCLDGGWAITFGTPDLLGCGTVVTTRAQCDPVLEVLARLDCTGVE